MMRSPC
jgi:hypothetical protein